VQIILTHTNADFDAVAALLAAYKLNSDSVPVLPDALNHNVEDFFMLYRDGLPFVQRSDFRGDTVERVILVDTQRIPQGVRGITPKTPVHIIDHHTTPGRLKPNYSIDCVPLGATTTLLVEQLAHRGVAINSLEATLMTLGIYEDTGTLTYSATTPRDVRAAAWLLEHGAALDTVRRFLFPPLNDDQRALLEMLLKAGEARVIQGYPITVAAATIDHYVVEISSVAHRLRDMLDMAALFVAVQMPDSLQMVCRATGEILDVGEIARFFGGGGHERAAAATVRDRTLSDTVSSLWQQIEKRVRPVTRVADLMSYGVQTLDADKSVGEVIQQMRRIGHEGYPVVERGHVVGLLTRRDADRAVEHGLDSLKVREIMTSGEVTLRPDDSVSALEQVMVESGWGQIPVVDDRGTAIGVVTRTDLIKHWAHVHPAAAARQTLMPLEQIRRALGEAVLKLIEMAARHAQAMNLSLYLVGGVVRDLLLERRNLDIDFVVESDASRLAESLCSQYGGRVSPPSPFGTVKWVLDESVAAAMDVDFAALPAHIDFATSRNEFYEHPTALPTVYNSSIKLDLQRRDFTINSLAVQLSPASMMGRILDFNGGLNDLKNKLIRVLHSLSFVDDPTRVLRAVRFEQRLAFTIEPHTAELIDTALPMLRRIKGERLRNELTLLLREAEPEKALLNLQARGVLAAIHPAFVIDERVHKLAEARTLKPRWELPALDVAELNWHLLAVIVAYDELPAWCQRLMFGRTATGSLMDAAEVVRNLAVLRDPQARPSQIARLLDHRPPLALWAAWIMLDDALAQERLQQYMLTWKDVRISTTGHDLIALGEEPGPRFKIILDRLREARLDGEIATDEQERRMLRVLVTNGGSEDDSP
jgi:tRNA nucleotidyltransferase (CCA-adding enzyme)